MRMLAALMLSMTLLTTALFARALVNTERQPRFQSGPAASRVAGEAQFAASRVGA